MFGMKFINTKALAIVFAFSILPWQSFANETLAEPSVGYDDDDAIQLPLFKPVESLGGAGRPSSIGWAEFTKQTKTLEKKLEWVFPSPTKYICPEKDGIGNFFDYDKKNQLSRYGNVTIEISNLGKKLIIRSIPDALLLGTHKWSQWVDEEDDEMMLEMIYLSKNKIFSFNKQLVSVHTGGCAEEEIFSLQNMQKPAQICVKIAESWHNAFSSHIVNCMLLN